jgi:hypothetical protein
MDIIALLLSYFTYCLEDATQASQAMTSSFIDTYAILAYGSTMVHAYDV